MAMKKILDKIKQLPKMAQQKDVLFMYILAGVITLVGIAILVWVLFGASSGRNVIEEFVEDIIEQNDEECEHRRYYDGVCMEDDDYDRRLVAVMIENHTASRPQSGLADAAIVYEAPVEANFTRFLALYPFKDYVHKIGPVRSARPYYLDWVEEYGAPMYMHVGGSPEALEQIVQRDMFDVNEFSYGWYFWRSKDRYAPHNTYTSSKLYDAAWEKYGDKYDDYYVTSTWEYSDELDCVNGDENDPLSACVEEVKITFALPSYITRWKYNTSTAQFDRYQTEGQHIDADGTPIVADTVIVQEVSSKVIDAIGRKKIGTLGLGAATIFANGTVTEGRWEKTSKTGKTMWYDDNNQPIPLKPGKIWIEVVGQDSEFEYSLYE